MLTLSVSKKPPTVKMQILAVGLFYTDSSLSYNKKEHLMIPKKACFARHFDFLRKPSPTVPSYADELALLVLTPFLNAVILPKNKFFDSMGL